MWRREGKGTAECVRVGATSVERWVVMGQGLSLVASQALPDDALADADGLPAAVSALYPTPPAGPVSLVLESAWMPLLLADTGGALWSLDQVEALLRHQMATVHADGPLAAAPWELRVDHRIGDRHALGYALAPSVKRALLDGGQGAGVAWAALVPAFAWGWQRLQPVRQPALGDGWWLWPEQDRSLLACVRAGRVVGLHAGLAAGIGHPEIDHAVAAEAVRQGVPADHGLVMAATWLATARLTPARETLRWVSIIGDGAALPATVRPAASVKEAS